jgi:hypothetical protein
MKCRHCRHSIGTMRGLWCALLERVVTRACEYFEREPGADDE